MFNLLEEVVLKELLHYVSSSDLVPEPQSTYRSGHSTKTALAKILGGIIKASDEGLVTAALSLNRSAHFDTIDHATLMDRRQ